MYQIVYLNSEFAEMVLAQVPYTEMNAKGALQRAYDIAEFLAERMFPNPVLREMKGHLFPMYWADREAGDTISIK